MAPTPNVEKFADKQKLEKKNTNKRTSKMMGILCKKQVETDTILQQRYEKDNRVNLPCVSTEPLNVT